MEHYETVTPKTSIIEVRPIKELLQLMLKHKNLFDSGLCFWGWNLWRKRIISKEEYGSLVNYIIYNRPKKEYISISDAIFRKKYGEYYWKRNVIYPRISWIKHHIKKLSK